MQPYSDYEIAQRRISERQRKITQFRASLVFVGVMNFITLVSSNAGYCTIPLAILGAFLSIANGIELYYTTPSHAPSRAEIEQETLWLFGEDRHDVLSAQAHMFAQDRIRKRRIEKWRFVGHLLLFIPLDGFIAIAALRATFPGNLVISAIAVAWLIIFISDARSTFPSKSRLEKREIMYGETIQFELAYLQSTSPKPKEKLKRGKYYEVGDDGELVEVEDEVLRLEEKPKREAGGL